MFTPNRETWDGSQLIVGNSCSISHYDSSLRASSQTVLLGLHTANSKPLLHVRLAETGSRIAVSRSNLGCLSSSPMFCFVVKQIRDSACLSGIRALFSGKKIGIIPLLAANTDSISVRTRSLIAVFLMFAGQSA